MAKGSPARKAEAGEAQRLGPAECGDGCGGDTGGSGDGASTG